MNNTYSCIRIRGSKIKTDNHLVSKVTTTIINSNSKFQRLQLPPVKIYGEHEFAAAENYKLKYLHVIAPKDVEDTSLLESAIYQGMHDVDIVKAFASTNPFVVVLITGSWVLVYRGLKGDPVAYPKGVDIQVKELIRNGVCSYSVVV